MGMTKAERRQYQADLESDAAVSPRSTHHRPINEANRCPAAMGQEHSFTMRGNDGVYRCWYCCKTKVLAAVA